MKSFTDATIEFGGIKAPVFGVEIIESPFLPTDRRQVKFPRSKKRRVRKKWAKQPKNLRSFETVYQVGNRLVMTSKLCEEFRRLAEEKIALELLPNEALQAIVPRVPRTPALSSTSDIPDLFHIGPIRIMDFPAPLLRKPQFLYSGF